MIARRPMLIAFGVLIVLICVWAYVRRDTGYSPLRNVPVECVGQIEDIQIKADGKTVVLSDVKMIQTNSKEAISADKILLYDFTENNLFQESQIGNIIKISGGFSNFERAGNPGGFDEYFYYSGKNIQGKIYIEFLEIKSYKKDGIKDFLLNLREQAMQHLLSVMDEGDAGLLGAMILGDKSYLPEETKEMYQQVGIAHMLAISGLHISLLGAGLFLFLRTHVMKMQHAVIVTVVFLFLYGEFTGFPVATTRAVLMMCCALFARYTGRSYDPVSALAFSGIVILLQEPYQLFQCGFLLSFSAIIGILLFQPVLERWNIKNKILLSFASSVPVTLTTLPVMLWFFYEISPYSIFANMVVLPFLALLIGVGILGCVVCFFWNDGGGFLLSTVHYVLQYYEMVCKIIDQLPYSRIVTGQPSNFLIIMYYLVLIGMVYAYLKFSHSQIISAGVVLLISIVLFFRPRIRFMYTQLDVGQGDCACVFYGEQTLLVDGGSSSQKEVGKYVIQKFLKYYGRTEVDTVFLSHSDGDHVNGVLELIENQKRWNLNIHRVVLPNITHKDDTYKEMVQMIQGKNVKIEFMKRGDQLKLGDLVIVCLHPYPTYEWQSENDYSLTLDLRYQTLKMLLTGDLEEGGEEAIGNLSNYYDILKVGHHGSKSSTSEHFLEQVSPAYALISAGRNNRYGHPAVVTLDKLKGHHVQICNTIDMGAISVQYENGKYKIESFRRYKTLRDGSGRTN